MSYHGICQAMHVPASTPAILCGMPDQRIRLQRTASPSDWPHPESVIHTTTGHRVELKVHRGLWSGTYPENSLPAIEECYRAGVARLEIDVCMLHDVDFLVVHDLHVDHATNGTGAVAELTRKAAGALRLLHNGQPSTERPPLLSEVVELIGAQSTATLIELDLKELTPMPWQRVEELARIVEPVKDRVIFGGIADWNLRRLLQVDPTLVIGFNPAAYFDWAPEGREAQDDHLPCGAYGYLDAHPLARQRATPVAEYLSDRFGGILRLVPSAREAHLRLATFERMLDNGVGDAANLFHRHGLALDVWTLDAGTPRWQERLARALAAGVDIITTNTARALAATLTP